MYIVEWWSIYFGRSCRAALASREEIFSLIVSLDTSKDVGAWRVSGYNIKSAFGFCDTSWEKYKEVWDSSVYKS